MEPARRLGLDIDQAVVQDVLLPQLMDPALVQDGRPSVRDAEHTIEPPLLQIVYKSWYKKAEEAYETVLGIEAYAALGSIRTIHNDYLDKALEEFGSEKVRAWEVLKALVSKALEEFGSEKEWAREVLKALVSKEGTPQVVSLDTLLSRLHAGKGSRRQPISFWGRYPACTPRRGL